MDPRDPSVRARMVATAVQQGLAVNVRYTALTRLALVARQQDTVSAASTVASSVPGTTEDERWLVDNAIGVLSRAGTDQSRAALAGLASSSPGFKHDAVVALQASTGGRPQ